MDLARSALGAQHSALRLSNGARVLVVPRPASPTVALQVFVAAGSRHDGPLSGLAHLVEHLVFRAPGGARRDLYAAVERLGGELGGGTTRDYTSFEITVAAPDAQAALALLPDLLRPPAADAASFAAEQRIVAQELGERAAPVSRLWDALLAALWHDHPLVHPPIGTVASIERATPAAAAALHAARYRAAHVLVVVVGACDVQAALAAVEEHLTALPASDAAPAAQPPPTIRAGTIASLVDGEVAWVAVGGAAAGLGEPCEAACRLLATILSEGPSARLPRWLAARGVAARAQARYVPYAGAGVLAVLAVCPAESWEAAEGVLAAAREELAAAPPSGDELAAARRRYLGAAARQCETNADLARAIGPEVLLSGAGPLAHSVAAVAHLTAADLAAAAHEWPRTPLARARLLPAPTGHAGS